jgi:hypothetical protein
VGALFCPHTVDWGVMGCTRRPLFMNSSEAVSEQSVC